MATAVKYKPGTGASGLTMKRDDIKFTASWDLPVNATASDNSSRWTSQATTFYLYYVRRKDMKDSKGKKAYGSALYTALEEARANLVKKNAGSGYNANSPVEIEWVARRSYRFWKNNVKDKSRSYWITRKEWYPYTDDIMSRIRIEHWSENWKGWGPMKGYDYWISPPDPPKLSLEVNKETNDAECTIKNESVKGDIRKERVDTQYWIYRQDSKGVLKAGTYEKKKLIYYGKYDSYGDWGQTWISRANCQDTKALLPGQWIEISWEVMNRGLGGDSNYPTVSHIFAYPAKASIYKIVLSNPINLGDSTGIVSVWLKTNSSKYAPVDKVQLQRLRNTSASTASAAGMESGWTDVDNASDTNSCSGLTDYYVDAIPDPGFRTWYRIKSTHDALVSYSTPVEAKAMYRKLPTASDDSVAVIKCEGNRDGESLKVTLGWNNDDSDGTEISWAKFADAWESTSPPSTYKVTWKDPTSSDIRYLNTATVYIRGLEEGSPYYVKARRYKEASGQIPESFGKYNSPTSAYWPTVVSTASSGSELKDVQLYVQQPLIRGRDTSASWTYDSENIQTGWELHALKVGSNIVDTIVAKGTDNINSTIIKAHHFKEETDIAFYLRMTTGSEWVQSYSDGADPLYIPSKYKMTKGSKWKELKPKTWGTYKTMPWSKASNATLVASEYYFGASCTRLKVFDIPETPVLANYKLTKQPFKLFLKSTSAVKDYIFTIRSRGIERDMPGRDIIQADGDIIYSNYVTPTWSGTAETGFTTSIEFPKNLPFLDKGSYVLEATAVDPDTKLHSRPALAAIKVDWSKKAVAPSKKSVVTANANSKMVTIKPIADEGGSSTDVCDIYRMTPDGAALIAENVSFGSVVTDKWAPYSKVAALKYRLATRTVDGSVSYVDIPYNLNGYSIRFDWDKNRYLEVPFNLRYSDKYKKDFEERSHLNGEHAGFWNMGASRTNSSSTQLVRLSDPEQVEAVRELAHYPGAVFVRFPNGCAFMANVDVTNIDNNYDSLVLDVSFDITEVIMSSEFMVAATDIKNP